MQPLDEAGQALAVEAIGRARTIADRYARLFPEHAEDFESSANWAIVKAAQSFEPDKGQTWDRWSRMAVKAEIRDLLSLGYNQRRKLWPQDALEDVHYEPLDSIRAESAEALEKLLGLLPPRHKEVCSLVYKEDVTPYSAGQALGMTGDYGCQLHREALVLLRGYIAA